MHIKKIYDTKNFIEILKRYCSLNDKCQWDIKQKMEKWKLPKISQDHILELLIQEGYIDEKRYSKSFCRGKFRIKKWGRIKIATELKKKYISKLSIEIGLTEINDTEYKQELDKQYHNKKNSIKEKSYFIKKKKIATYLISKGYESNLVWDKIRELKQ